MFVAPAPSIPEAVEKLGPEVLGKVIAAQAGFPTDDDYVHWDKLRHLTPPEGMNTEEWWLGIKFRRMAALRFLPLTSPDGLPFSYSLPDIVLRYLHRVDQRCSG